MKKKFYICLASFILAATCAVGVVFALFQNVQDKNLSFNFGKIDYAATVESTGGLTAAFANPGDEKTYSIGLNSAVGSVPYGYELSITQAAANDPDFAGSVLVYFDSNLLGTVASVFQRDAAAFDANSFVYTADRILGVNGDRASETHSLRLVFHAGAGSLFENKKINLNVATRASSLDVARYTVVKTAAEYEDILGYAAAGSLTEGYRVILAADIVSTKSFSITKPMVLDLNGYNLTTDLTVAGGRSRALSYAASSLGGVTVNGATAFLSFADTLSPDVTVTSFDKAAAVEEISAIARRALYAGAKGTGTVSVPFARANTVYSVTGNLASAANAAVNGGVVSAVIGASSYNASLTLSDGAASSQTIPFTVYGSDSASAAAAELDAVMAAQGIPQGTDATATAVAYNLLLPRTLVTGGASVVWTSDYPAVFTAQGRYVNAVGYNGGVTLTARIAVNGTVVTRSYTATVVSQRDNAAVLSAIIDAYGELQFTAIGEKHFIPTIESLLDAQKSKINYGTDAEETAKWDNVSAKIRGSGILSFTYKVVPDSLTAADGSLSYNNTDQIITLTGGSSIHVAKLQVTATFDTEPLTVTGEIPVYIDVASVTEAMKYLNNVVDQRGNIAQNVRNDRYHRIDENGADMSHLAADANNGIYQFHSKTVNNNVFGSAGTNGVTTSLGKTVSDGSFVLPATYTSTSTLMNVSGKASANVKTYYYYLYNLSMTDLYGALNNSPDPLNEEKNSGDPAVTLGAPTGLNFGDASSQTIANAIIPYNNFFLLDLSKLPVAATNYTLQVGLYQASGDNYNRMLVQSISLPIPSALHMDKDGFEDAAIFNAVYNALMTGADADYHSGAKPQLCDQHSDSATIITDIAADAKKLELTSTASAPLQVSGSMAGLAAFTGLDTLSLIGTSSQSFFVSDAAAKSMGTALIHLSALRNVTMRYCGLESIDPVKALPLLENLDFSYNAQLDDIAAAMELINLRLLDVSYCGFGFDRVLDWQSPFATVSVFEAIYTSNENIAVEIKYTYKSGTSDILATYVGRANSVEGVLSSDARKARNYALMMEAGGSQGNEFIGGNTYFTFPSQVIGHADAKLSYRILSGKGTLRLVTQPSDSDYSYSEANYTSPTWSGSTWSGGTSLPASANQTLRLKTGGKGDVDIVQMIVVVGSDFYTRNFRIMFI